MSSVFLWFFSDVINATQTYFTFSSAATLFGCTLWCSLYFVSLSTGKSKGSICRASISEAVRHGFSTLRRVAAEVCSTKLLT